MKRIVVIGAGSHSRAHGAALRQLVAESPERVALAAVCDLDQARAEAYAQAFGFQRACTRWPEMIEREAPDGILAITPVPLTGALAAALLPRRIPLLMEKPPGATSTEAEALLRIATEHGTPHMVSFNRRFCPCLTKAREWLAQAGCPGPGFVLGRMVRVARTEPDFLTATGIHLLDAMLSFLGPPTRIAAARVRASREGAAHDYALLETGAGRAGHCVFAPDAGVLEETYELHGAGVSLRADVMACRLSVWRKGEAIVEWTAPEGASPEHRNGTLGETDGFLRLIEGRPAPWHPTLTDAWLALRTAERIEQGGWAWPSQ